MMIDVKDLGYRYPKGKTALHEISFSVEEGSVFGFLGPNGSGKSTTQKLLTGLLHNYSGSIKITGKEITSRKRQFYESIGVLFEFPYLYSALSGIDNLKYFSSFYPAENCQDIETLLKKVALKEEFWLKPVASYSKGMKQRVSMARVLMSSPKLLFLDEPTAGLDPAGAVLFRNIIQEQKQAGSTIFLTTHNMYDADQLCDKVALITDGEIKALDTPHNLKTMNNKSTLEDVFIQYTGKGLGL